MKKNRLIAFGCSNTFGESLPDCKDRPSKYAWPNILAKKMNLEAVNLGVNAASNKLIWSKILGKKFKKTDIVVILWTYFHRTCFFDKETEHFVIPAWANKSKSRSENEFIFNRNYYTSFYFEKNLNLESFVYIDHAKNYLDSNGIKNYHFTFCRDSKHSPLPINNIKTPKWFSTNLKSIEFIDDLASDNHHPSVYAHKDFANKIYNIIKV